MKSTFGLAAIGLAAGLGFATVPAQAQHEHSPARPQQHPATSGSMEHMQMMGDPAMHQQMMNGIRMCRDTQTQAMAHLNDMARTERMHRPSNARVHRETLERLRQCRDTLTRAMAHMDHMAQMMHPRP